jgi:hypothetical protein
MYSLTRLLLLYNYFVLVNFDYPGTIVSQHLVIYLIDNTFVLESGKIIDLFQLERIDEIPVLIDQTDLNVRG